MMGLNPHFNTNPYVNLLPIPLFLILILILVLASCATPIERNGASSEDYRISDTVGHITVWHDDVRDVTCWLYHGPAYGGIFCMTDKELVGEDG